MGTILCFAESPSCCYRQFAVCHTAWEKSPFRNSPAIRELSTVPSTSLAPKAKPLKPIDRKPTGKADRDSVVKKFLIDRVPKWDEDLQLSALGLDSLDTVQLRNAFNATFHVRLPLGLFAAPNQTLRQLYSKLIDSVPQS